MTDRENLPAKALTRDVAVPTVHSLVVRGLLAIRTAQQDKRYRQARAIADIICDDPWRKRTIEDSAVLFEAFQALRQLADEGYGKAYYPLARLYKLHYV